MIPILFESTATQFRMPESPYLPMHGLGELSDAIRCEVTMANDGMYELELEYPTTGRLFTELATQYRIIYASANQVDAPQAFRIYQIRRQIDGRLIVNARHVSYDLEFIPVGAFQAPSAVYFALLIKQNALTTCPFTFATDVDMPAPEGAPYKNEAPASARSLLVSSGTDVKTWTDYFGGHMVFDNFTVYRIANTVDRHVCLRYGRDLVDARLEQNIETVITGVLPFYSKDGTTIVGDIVPPQTATIQRVKTVDVTELFSDPPAGTAEQKKAQVEGAGYTWMNTNGVGTNELNLKIDYAQIDQIIRLDDQVSVKLEHLGIDVVTQVCKTVWDSLAERYTSIEVGNTRTSFAADLSNAKRLTKGEISPDRIKNGSIGSSKLGGGVNSKLNAMVTNPYNGNLTVNGIICGGHQFVPVYVTISGNPYYILASNMSPN